MDKIRLKNYRCFSDTSEINLKPVNILLGKNSVGKSSFLKFFPLLKQSRMKHPNGLFLWYADDVDFKDFKNTVRNGEGNIEMEISFKRPVILRSNTSNNRSQKAWDIKFALTLSGHPKDENLDYMSYLKICVADVCIEIEFDAPDDKEFYFPLRSIKINDRVIDVDAGIIPQISTSGFIPQIFFRQDEGNEPSFISRPVIESETDLSEALQKIEEDLNFSFFYRRNKNYLSTSELIAIYGRLPKKIAKKVKSGESFIELFYLQNLNNILSDINEYVDYLARNIYYIQPVRANAKRYYRIQNLAVDEIDSHGDNVPMFLNSLSAKALESLNKWIEPLFRFRLDVRPKEGHIQINIIETENGIENPGKRNLVDVGFGYSQLLPIIVQIWNAVKKPGPAVFLSKKYSYIPKIIVIEQPELHLHPRMMSFFAKMLISLMSKDRLNVRFIIETHSEALIESLGRDISSMYANPDSKPSVGPEIYQILIFNKDKTSEETSIIATHYNNNGFIDEWPYGFFSGDK